MTMQIEDVLNGARSSLVAIQQNRGVEVSHEYIAWLFEAVESLAAAIQELRGQEK